MDKRKGTSSKRILCGACLKPIKGEDGICLRDGGLSFHKVCLEQYPNNYFVKREKRKALE